MFNRKIDSRSRIGKKELNSVVRQQAVVSYLFNGDFQRILHLVDGVKEGVVTREYGRYCQIFQRS